MDYFLSVQAFSRIVETGSFVKAAALMNLHPNAMTRLMHELEAHLRVKLLNRTTRRVTLTGEGAVYYERMRGVLDQWLEVESEMSMSNADPRGRIRVDMGTTIASMIVIPALSDFHARYPHVQVDIGASDRTADLASEGIDCVIRGGDLPDSALVARRLGSLPFVTCATPAYLAAHDALTHPSQLEQGHTLVRYFFASTGKYGKLALTQGSTTVVVEGTYTVAVNDSNAYVAAGVAGLGVLHTPCFMVQAQLDSGALVPVLADWTAPPNTLSVVYMPNRHLSVRVRAFVDWLVQLFAQRTDILH